VGIAIFFLLALIVAGFILYPLLPGRAPAPEVLAVTDGAIEQAVRDMRRSRSRPGLNCPACGKGYQVGDHFCVRCGSALPQAASPGLVCPSCSTTLEEGDRFCAKCGHQVDSAEVA
jgi:rRNA maturation endonuclease Nob1